MAKYNGVEWEVITKDGARYLVAGIGRHKAEISANELREFLPQLYESVPYTTKQLEIMKFIRDFRKSNNVSPTLEEVAEELGVTQITIYSHMNRLERKGAIKREAYTARSVMTPDPAFL